MPLSQTPAPQLNFIKTRSERQAAGVGDAYVDSYNDALMAKYNNDYNYWLWQQQAEYNTPAAQMERAKAAGLNPNMVAQNVSSGNLTSMPTSSGKLSGNIRANELQSANLALNSFNSALKMMSEGVQATSTLSGIPDDISTYRKMLTSQSALGNERVLLENMLKRIELAKGAYEVGLDPEDDYSQRIGFALDPDSPAARQIDLRNDLMFWKTANAEFDFEHLKPEQVKQLQQRALLLGTQIGLNEQELHWFTAMATTKIGAALMPLLVPLLKKAL